MKIFAYIYFILLAVSAVFFLVGVIIERNFDESHPVKKWWRRNVVGWDPEQKRPDDDFYI